MKILITENQLRNLISESERADKVIDRVLSDTQLYNRMEDILDELVGVYGFTPVELVSNDRLYNLLLNKLIKTVYIGRIPMNRYGKVIGALVERYIEDMFKGNVDTLTMIDRIIKIRRFTDRGQGRELDNLLDGLVDDGIKYIFRKYKDPKDIIKYLSILKEKVGKDSGSLVIPVAKDIAKKYGYTIVDKPLGWTFERGGGRVQQIIDYIKDVPKLPQKTRKGWMEYVGEDPNRAGWNSYLWRAVQDAGIITKVRDGRSFVYTLGPNAKSFEDGTLIGF